MFTLTEGDLNVVTHNVGQVGRLCAGPSGRGSIEAQVGHVLAGTYTITADVKKDPNLPASSWLLDATTYDVVPTETPTITGIDGPLEAVPQTITKTVVVGGNAVSTTFAVRLGTEPSTCMLLEDIRVVYRP
jgi:hypothetical protein